MMVMAARAGEQAWLGGALPGAGCAGPAGSALAHETHLGGGVRVVVDLLRPGRWRTVSAPAADPDSVPLVRALAGVADELRGPVLDVAGDPAGARPWLRVAVVDALDRWLQAPVSQALVDAERAVSRLRAARTLPGGALRSALVGEALQRARGASRGVALSLRELGARSPAMPELLASAVQSLVDGYEELAAEVGGPDRELAAVGEAWRRRLRPVGGARRRAASAHRRPEPAGTPPSSMIDPRLLRARILRLAADPARPEIVLEVDGAAVHVRVPAFGGVVDPTLRTRLAVRLVDRRTTEPTAHALLTGTVDGPYFEATLPLGGLAPTEVRADVFDALGDDLPPVPTDADPALQDARRAVVYLGEWRRLVGLARLPGAPGEPARRLRDLAARVRPAGAGLPAFRGGPTGVELDALAAMGDADLAERLRTDTGDELLVAELVAVHLAR